MTGSTREVRLSLADAISRTKPPILVFAPQLGHWRIWTAYDRTLSYGTYIDLFQDGTMQRVTVQHDGTTQSNML